MIAINNITILSDRKTMNISVSADTGLLINSVNLWDNTTFKDYTVAKDFTSKLAQTSENEVFTITSDDLGITEFSGIYFVEFLDNDTTPSSNMGMVAELSAYKECALSKILDYIYSGKDCSSEEACEIINIDTLITGLNSALDLGYIYESISLLKSLEKLCTNSCAECPPLTTVNTSLEVLGTCTRVAFNLATLSEDSCLDYPPAEHVAIDNVAYHNGTGLLPIAGDTVYTSPLCTDSTVHATGDYWTGTKHIIIDGAGVVQASKICV